MGHNLRRLLDLDELNQDQKAYLESLITYVFESNKIGGYDLVFYLKNNKHQKIIYSVGDDNTLNEGSYKQMMDFIIVTKLKYALKDLATIELIKEMFTSFPRLKQDPHEKNILINNEVYRVPYHYYFKSQDLYKIIIVLKDKGLL